MTNVNTLLQVLSLVAATTTTTTTTAFSLQPLPRVHNSYRLQHLQSTSSPELPPESMTTIAATPFVTSEPLLADPTFLVGQTPSTTSSSSSSSAYVEKEKVLSQWVPPSKSLRSRLKLPVTQLVSTVTTVPTTRPRIVGHRGSLYEELENTRAGFLACAGIAHAIELDVFQLKDGTLVVFHGSGNDQNPGLLEGYCVNGDQVQEGAISILDLSYEQTQELIFNTESEELAAPDDKVLAGRIPTLEQVLKDLKPTGLEVKIELKGKGTAKPCVELVDQLGMVDQVSFSSFNFQEIATVRELRPQNNPDGSHVYKTGALFDQVPENFIQLAQQVQASEVHLRYDTCTVDRVQAIHEAGMSSMAWYRGPIGMKEDVVEKYWDIGNEDERCYEAVMETGVEQLCVNKPRVLYEYLRKRGLVQPTAVSA